MKKLLFLFIFLLLLNTVKSELIITPQTLSIEVNINEEKNVTFELYNNFSFPIYNIEFSDVSDIVFNNINVLDVNQTVTTTLKIKTTTSYNQQKTSNIKFNYLSNIITQPSTYEVNITQSGFSPSFISLVKNSNINFVNRDVVKHSVTSSLFSYDINPSNSQSIAFNTIGEVNYHDTYIGFGGIVNVNDSIAGELTHNPDYDKTLTLNINSKLINTQLELEILDDSFNLTHLTSSDGLLRIKNIGNENAVNVRLSNDKNWMIYESNNFNIDKNSNKIVRFTVIPIITNTNDTDKTHTVNVNAVSDNSVSVSDSLNVFIQYAEISQTNQTLDEIRNKIQQLIDEARRLQEALPDSEKEIIYRDSELPVNYTQRDVFQMKNDLASLSTKYDLLVNQLKIALDNYNNILNLQGDINNSVDFINQRTNRDVESRETLSSSLIFFTTAIILSVSLGTFSYFKYKNKLKKNILKK